MDQLFHILYTAYVLAGGYALLACVWIVVGWFPLWGMGRRLREENDLYDNFVREYFLYRGPILEIFSYMLIPCVAAGIINRSTWGRSFRNLHPEEAEVIASNFHVSRREKLYSMIMIAHLWIVLVVMTSTVLIEGSLWVIRHL
ncbi:MAG: hypothetical protein JJU06_07145 [Ectothiorhodospiraceae bacterium]|nr:hypothetical protein [Ectothiorhodospiraceae bacterium]